MIQGPPAPRHQLETTARCQAHTLRWRASNKGSAHAPARVSVCVNTSAFSAWTNFNNDGSETGSVLQMLSSQAWLHRRFSMHTARDKIKHSRLLCALKHPGPWSMWSLYLFIFPEDWPQTIRIQMRNQREEHTSWSSSNAGVTLLKMKCEGSLRRQSWTRSFSDCICSSMKPSIGLF